MAVPTKIDVDESGDDGDAAIAALGVEPRSTRLARWLSSGPIYVVMVGIGLFWLFPPSVSSSCRCATPLTTPRRGGGPPSASRVS